MRWLLDTDVWIDAFAGRLDAVRVMTTARSRSVEWVGYSLMTRLEVLAGLTGADDKHLRELLEEFNEVHIGSDVIEEAIRIRRAVRIKAPDAIIAATSLVHKAELVTRNTADCTRIPGLTVLDTATL